RMSSAQQRFQTDDPARDGAQGARALLSAGLRARRRPDRRFGSAAALATSESRPAAAGRLYAAHGGDRDNRTGRRVGAAHGMRAISVMAPRRPAARRLADQPVRAPARP